jgi:urease accessory protein
VSQSPLRLEALMDTVGSEPTDAVRLTYDERVRSRFAVQLESGRDAVIVTPRGRVMRGGDCLRAEDGSIVRVVAAPEPLLEVRVEDPALLARAAYHLGNRHVAVEVRPQSLRIAEDPVLSTLLRQLGLNPIRIEAPFEPESGAYGHGHAHVAGGHAITPLIHEYHSHD